MIEKLFKDPYLEMFARNERPGWTAWGNQTDKFQVDKLGLDG
jgi:N6-adenosine-specific RNA methylase IME4